MDTESEHDVDPGSPRAEPGAGSQAPSSLDAAPGLVRIYARGWLRTAEWTASTALRAGTRLTRAALSGESAAELAEEVRAGVRDSVRRVLGVTDIERRLGGTAPGSAMKPEPLRERGAELLERSADLDDEEEGHPAFERILTQLAPDEARILRLLAVDGPQPAVDVRTWRPLGLGSRVVGPGISMIGRRAGLMRPDRVPAYLANLFRLGLIWFSHDELRDLQGYQVLEAQPEVIEASKQAGRASTVRRSIRLTPFGTHFCDFCLPLDTAEFEAVTSADRAEPAGTDEKR